MICSDCTHILVRTYLRESPVYICLLDHASVQPRLEKCSGHECVSRLTPELTKGNQSVTIPVVPRKQGGAYGINLLSVRELSDEWTEEMSSLSRRVHEELAKITYDDFTAEEERHLQELCSRVSKKGEDSKATLHELWNGEFSNASSRLRKAFERGLVLPSMPSIPTQTVKKRVGWPKGKLRGKRKA